MLYVLDLANNKKRNHPEKAKAKRTCNTTERDNFDDWTVNWFDAMSVNVMFYAG